MVEAKKDSKKEEKPAAAAAAAVAAAPAKKVEESSDAKKVDSTAAAAATTTAEKDDSAAAAATAAAATETKKVEAAAAAAAAAEAPKKEEAATAATEEVTAEAPTTTEATATTTEPAAAAEAAPDNRNKRVYVGNLAWGVSWQDLKDHMKTTGFDVNRANIMMTPDGRSKGCGIVEFATAEGAEKAVETLNDTELSGRQIFVREDREDRGGGSGGDRGGGGGGYRQPYRGGGGGQQASTNASSSGGDAQNNNTTSKSGVRVYVGNLSWDVAWQDLKDHMRQAGEVVTADVICENNGRSKGCGIVEFATASEAQEAISTLTDTELKGRMIFVREDRETSGGGSGGRGGGYGGRGGGRGGRGRGRGRYRGGRGGGGQQHNNNNNNHQNDGEGGESSGGGGGCQLFVGQLSYDTTWKELKDHFRQCGDVERAEVMSNMDGRSKGFGTVRFYNQKDADSAIRRLNGVELQGRSLVVRIDSKAN